MKGQWWVWVLAVAVFIVVALLAMFLIGLIQDRRSGAGRHAAPRPSRDSFRKVDPDEPPPPKKRAAVIVNPTKVADPAALAAQISAVMATQGWDAPLILDTTVEEPGGAQARRALSMGVDLVCVLGGDGTVRHVAQAVAGSTTPLGLLPAGTGNLLARNLRVPGESVEDALVVAMTGRNRHIDVGWVTLDPPEPQVHAAVLVALPDAPSAQAVADTIENAAADLAAADLAAAEVAAADLAAAEVGAAEVGAADLAAADLAAAPGPVTSGGGEDRAAGAEHGIRQNDPAPTAAVTPPDAGNAAAVSMRADTGGLLVDEASRPTRHAFLVMAGLGFDAAIMDDTSDELKASIGWPAYISGGMRNLLRRRFHTTLVLDGAEPQHFRTRTVLAGNCGRLTGGIVLMPDAAIDDGELNVVVISPKGLAGWAAVAAHVLTQRGQGHVRLDRFTTSRAHVTVDEPQAVQADGDVLGEASSILLEIEPQSLIVRVGSTP